MLSAIEVASWLADPEQPKLLCYHRGHLAADRLRHEMYDGKVVEVVYEPLNSIASSLYEAWERGQVLLFQKRDMPGIVEYWALRKG